MSEQKRQLDLYLSGDFHKDMLIDKKSELEKAIGELKRQRSVLLVNLRTQTLSEQQEQALMEFARKISAGLDCADSNFQTRHAIIETLGVEATLYQEEGVKKFQSKCNLGEVVSALSPFLFIVLDAIRNICARVILPN